MAATRSDEVKRSEIPRTRGAISDSMNKRPLLFFFALFLTACAPLLAPPGAPTLDEASLNTIVAQTAAAAATQTALVVGSPTPIPTSTLLITTTPTEIPTLTATFIFVLPTLTQPKPTATQTATPSASGGYACQILSQAPVDDTVFAPNADFDAVWQVKNTGTKTWDKNNADYRYVSGDKFHQQPAYDFPKTVNPGAQVNIVVDMKAPNNSGTYTTRWEIRIGQNHFCTMRMTIEVQ